MENKQIIDRAKTIVGFEKSLKPQQIEFLLCAIEGRDVISVFVNRIWQKPYISAGPFCNLLEEREWSF